MRGVGTGVMRGGQSPREIEYSFNSLPDVVVYLDPAYSETIELNGGDVSGITDRGPSAHVFSQDTAANQPLYDTTGINGSKTIDFTRANNDTINADASITHNIGTGDFYFIALYHPESINRANIFYWRTNDVAHFLYEADDGGVRHPEWGTSTTTIFPSLTPSVNTSHVLEMWRDGTSIRVRLNNTLDTDSQTSSRNLGSSNTVTRYGGDEFGSDLDGRSGLVVITSSLPNLAQRDAARRKAAAKWGI